MSYICKRSSAVHRVCGHLRISNFSNFDRFQAGPFHNVTLTVGDPIIFRLEMDIRDSSKKAVKIALDLDVFSLQFNNQYPSLTAEAADFNGYKHKVKEDFKKDYETSLAEEKRDNGVIGAIVADHGYGFIKGGL